MPKFIIVVEGNAELIEAPDEAAAEQIAYDTWLQQADQDYYVEEATKDNLAAWELETNEEETENGN